MLLKYGRDGKSKARTVFLDKECSRVHWCRVEKSGKKVATNLQSIQLRRVAEVALGSESTEIMRKNKVHPEFDSLCFSLVSQERTLDLKAQDSQTRREWVVFLRTFLRQRYTYLYNRSRAGQEKEQLKAQAVWKTGIFTNLDQYWDITKMAPHCYDRFREKQDKRLLKRERILNR